ncbi:MAG: hypothetical protein HY254_11060 [Burkholderiales bacterium]|nr:hypothetical protein [Burkholderiales bacterium]
MKHSCATEVVFWSAYEHTEKQMQLRIIDNGEVDDMCLPADWQGAGHGVLSMQARATQLGGKLDLEFTSHGRAANLVFPASMQMMLND